jgi:protein SCO1
MKNSAKIAIAIAALIPLGSFLFVSFLSRNIIHMPRHYYFDTVLVTEKDGRSYPDTVWHTLKPLHFTNQLGDSVNYKSVEGKIIVANCFFTRCPNICPILTRQMKKMQTSFMNPSSRDKQVNDTSHVHFLSFSVDPERDTTAALKAYADRFYVKHDNWWMLTGKKADIYDYMMNELKVPAEDGGLVDSNFIHTPKFVLIDKHLRVRGYYNGLDSLEMAHLAGDIAKLMIEKEKGQKSQLFEDIKALWPIWLLIVTLVAIFIFFFRKQAKTNF